MMRLLKRLIALASALATPVAAQPAAAQVTAFIHVNVVPMDRERILRDQTVIVENGTIAAIGPKATVPEGATVIDGHDAWLSPGLADMHVHSETPDELAIFLANGVTTVLAMGGARNSLVGKTAPRANRGEIASPHVYASFLVDGTPDYNGFVLKTPEQARAIVGLAKAQGYDFLKVYVGLTPPVFAALADEAKRQNLPIVGHGVYAVRIDRQLAAGQAMIAHAEEFLYSFLFPAGDNAAEGEGLPDPARIADAVAVVKKYDATVTADLLTYQTIAGAMGHPEKVAAILARPEMAELPPNWRANWRASDYFTKTAKLVPRAAFLARMVKAMSDGGVRLIMGTDVPTIPGMFPGVAVHDDLAALQAAGLTRYKALETATGASGDFIAKTKGGIPFGRIIVGDRADLILSRGNPLDDLATLRRPMGVMAAGYWRDAAALTALRDKVAKGYRESLLSDGSARSEAPKK